MSLANRMTLASPHVHTTTIEANEFPQLSYRFGVQGVPRTIVNQTAGFAGALPEEMYVARVLRLAGLDVEEPEEPD